MAKYVKLLVGVVVVELDSLDTLAVTSYRNSTMEELKDAFVDGGCSHLKERIKFEAN